KTRLRLKRRIFGVGRLAIPGADILADVAPKKMMADARSIRFGDFAAKFDGGIGDAFAAVENIRLKNGAGWTGIDAPRAAAASVGHRIINLEIQVRENTAKEKP